MTRTCVLPQIHAAVCEGSVSQCTVIDRTHGHQPTWVLARHEQRASHLSPDLTGASTFQQWGCGWQLHRQGSTPGTSVVRHRQEGKSA